MVRLNYDANTAYYRAEGSLNPGLARKVSFTHTGGAFTPNERLAKVYEDAVQGRKMFEVDLPRSVAKEYSIGRIEVAGVTGVVVDLPDWLRAHKREL